MQFAGKRLISLLQAIQNTESLHPSVVVVSSRVDTHTFESGIINNSIYVAHVHNI